MLRFRPASPSAAPPAGPPELLEIGQMIDEAMQPGHFFVAPSLQLEWDLARSETIPWELFHGNLLDPDESREERTFLSWHVRPAEEGAEPLLSVKLDVHAEQIHVVSGLLCHSHEAYDSGGSVILSREVLRWKRELVGTIELARFTSLDEMRDELICLLWQAMVGTSRLPLTSVEAPLPTFTFGQLAYAYRAGQSEDRLMKPMRDYELIHEGLQPGLAWREQAKLLETILRSFAPTSAELAAANFLARWQCPAWASAETARLLRTLFNGVSLSPYTHFVDTALTFVDALVQHGGLSGADQVDFFAYLLRQLSRHLSAYDLVIFHHRGANYPDALLLDAVLRRYLALIERDPDLFSAATLAACRRRRALRHGCHLRRHYEGHLVPDVPTSPGENARVLRDYPRVPEEQLLQPLRRRRQLFADEPLTALLGPRGKVVLAQSIADLADPAERMELGMAVFIDRPLGYAKLAGEPDQTPLLAHECYSETLAQRPIWELERLCRDIGLDVTISHEPITITGISHTVLNEPMRPTAELADVRRVADDFVILRTLSGGLADLWLAFDFATLSRRYRIPFLATGRPRLVLPVADDDVTVLTMYDEALRPRLELAPDLSQGYARRAGVEFPVAGLRVLTVWEDGEDRPRDVRAEDVHVRASVFV